MSPNERVRIHYRRLPAHEEIFDQRVVYERDDVIVTLTDPLQLDAPLTVDETPILEPGSRAVWFTFPGSWHDIGRFHRADGTFAGCYANVLTPVRIEGRTWHTTDLFLDVWIPDGGVPRILDQDELDAALDAGHIESGTASRAREEAKRLVERARRGAWPPPVVAEWTLARALERSGG